ncbi:hypothetical protein B0H19DRAFT_1377487 [Mycena capillaripes]|nr:hypothetical protein B0H19DRAFT_1377487 [Mycena capillaripes]
MPDTFQTSQFPALDGTLGAMEIGAILGTFLFGIETLQTFNYYRRFPEDSQLLKATVAVIWFDSFNISKATSNRPDHPGVLNSSIQFAGWTQWIYSMTVTFYGRPASQHILSPPHTLNITILLSAPIHALVQLFFGNRIRILSGHWHIMVLCLFLTLLRFICDVALTIATWVSPSAFSALRSNVHWEMITASSGFKR